MNRDDIQLVLSDVVMPEMGGIALLHAMQACGLQVKVILLTGHPLREELDALIGQETHALLVSWMLKPPNLGALAACVARALGTRGGQMHHG